jgi:flotillin
MDQISVYFWLGLLGSFVALLLVSSVAILQFRYKRCPSNRVLVIYGRIGRGDSARCVHGGAAFVWPLIQDYAYLSLEPMQIEIPLRGALSAENIRVNVPSVFTVAVGTNPETMNNAAIRLLGLNTSEIKKQAEDIIFGQLRQVIASMLIEDINRDRDAFLGNIQDSLEPELKKIGLVLINVNITDITDESGYIEAIGQKAASQAIQQARGDVAEQEKLGETRVAEAERDRVIQVANATKLRDIGTREAMREQMVRIAELERDQDIGEQAASFERDAQVRDAETGDASAGGRGERSGRRRRKSIRRPNRRLQSGTADEGGRGVSAGRNKEAGGRGGGARGTKPGDDQGRFGRCSARRSGTPSGAGSAGDR